MYNFTNKSVKGYSKIVFEIPKRSHGGYADLPLGRTTNPTALLWDVSMETAESCSFFPLM